MQIALSSFPLLGPLVHRCLLPQPSCSQTPVFVSSAQQAQHTQGGFRLLLWCSRSAFVCAVKGLWGLCLFYTCNLLSCSLSPWPGHWWSGGPSKAGSVSVVPMAQP